MNQANRARPIARFKSGRVFPSLCFESCAIRLLNHFFFESGISGQKMFLENEFESGICGLQFCIGFPIVCHFRESNPLRESNCGRANQTQIPITRFRLGPDSGLICAIRPVARFRAIARFKMLLLFARARLRDSLLDLRDSAGCAIPRDCAIQIAIASHTCFS